MHPDDKDTKNAAGVLPDWVDTQSPSIVNGAKPIPIAEHRLYDASHTDTAETAILRGLLERLTALEFENTNIRAELATLRAEAPTAQEISERCIATIRKRLGTIVTIPVD